MMTTVEKIDSIVEKVRTFIESETATRLLLKVNGTLLKKEFLNRLIKTTEENDASYDFLWLNHEDEKIKIEDARRVNEFLSYSPSQAKHKYVISEEFASATPEAVSALLKITEEPPDFAVFIFFTSNPSQIFSTIRSRFTLLTLNVNGESLIEPERLKKIKFSVFGPWLKNAEDALYISKNFEKLEELFNEATDTFSTVNLITKQMLLDEKVPSFEISILAERLFLFLKREEVVKVYQTLKNALSSKNSLNVFKAFLNAALNILQDLLVLKETSYWKGIKRPPYIKHYIEMKHPGHDDMEWILKVRKKDYYTKMNIEEGIFLLLSKLVTLKGK
jgi:DNA polymerase III delta prime subunit